MAKAQASVVIRKAHKDGTSVTVKSTEVTYGVSSSGAVEPESWRAAMPGVTAWQWLWTKTVVTYSDGKKAETKTKAYQGKNGAQGPQGPQGADGKTWRPTVSADGTLSWAESASTLNPAAVNIKGEKGEDAYVVEVYTLTGDKIKNGEGSTDLYARVLKGGAVVEGPETAESERQFVYTWRKYNMNGVATDWAGTSSPDKAGNPVRVSAGEIMVKATFRCTVTRK